MFRKDYIIFDINKKKKEVINMFEAIWAGGAVLFFIVFNIVFGFLGIFYLITLPFEWDKEKRKEDRIDYCKEKMKKIYKRMDEHIERFGISEEDNKIKYNTLIRLEELYMKYADERYQLEYYGMTNTPLYNRERNPYLKIITLVDKNKYPLEHYERTNTPLYNREHNPHIKKITLGVKK